MIAGLEVFEMNASEREREMMKSGRKLARVCERVSDFSSLRVRTDLLEIDYWHLRWSGVKG